MGETGLVRMLRCCFEELAGFVKHRQELGAAGLEVVALNVDAIGQQGAAVDPFESDGIAVFAFYHHCLARNDGVRCAWPSTWIHSGRSLSHRLC